MANADEVTECARAHRMKTAVNVRWIIEREIEIPGIFVNVLG